MPTRPGQMQRLPSTAHFADLLMPAIRALHPPEAMQRLRRVDLAVTHDGKASDYALTDLMGHIDAWWFLPSTIGVGINQSTEWRVSADGVVERFDIRVKTAPTGAALIAVLRRTSVVISTVNIAAGTFAAGLSVNQNVSAGDILTIDISQVGSTVAGANLSAFATIREERRD